MKCPGDAAGQLPLKPDYARVKVARRLARIGAAAAKDTAYVLPRSDAWQEDFQWIVREVLAVGGEAALLGARFVDRLCDADIENLFRDPETPTSLPSQRRPGPRKRELGGPRTMMTRVRTLGASGLAARIAGNSMLQREDEARLKRGAEIFEELLTYCAKRRD